MLCPIGLPQEHSILQQASSVENGIRQRGNMRMDTFQIGGHTQVIVTGVVVMNLRFPQHVEVAIGRFIFPALDQGVSIKQSMGGALVRAGKPAVLNIDLHTS